MFQRPTIKKVIADGAAGASLRPPVPVDIPSEEPSKQEPTIVYIQKQAQDLLTSLGPTLDQYPLKNQATIITRSEYEESSLEVRDYYGAIGQRWGNHPAWTYYHMSRNILDDLSSWLPYVNTNDPIRQRWQVTISSSSQDSLNRIGKLKASEWGQLAECFVEGFLQGSGGLSIARWLNERERKITSVLDALKVLYQISVTDFHKLFRARRQLLRDNARLEGALSLYSMVENKVSNVLGKIREGLDFIPSSPSCIDLLNFEYEIRDRSRELLDRYVIKQREFTQTLQFRSSIDDSSLVRLEKGKKLLVYINKLRTIRDILRNLQNISIDNIDWKYEVMNRLENNRTDPLLEPTLILLSEESVLWPDHRDPRAKLKPSGLDIAT